MGEFEPMPDNKDTAQVIPRKADDPESSEVTDPDDPSYVEPATDAVQVAGTSEEEQGVDE